MDVDDDNTSLIFERAIRSETVFAKSQQMAVSFYSSLPVEVKQVLKNAGLINFFSSTRFYRADCLASQTFTDIHTQEMLIL